MARIYQCPKCKNRTLSFSESSNALTCSYVNWESDDYAPCNFRYPMPEQTAQPNDSQILIELSKLRN